MPAKREMTSAPKSDLVDLLAFNDWATHLLHGAVAALSSDEWTAEVGGSFGTIQGTVAHLVGAEWIWLERWKGRSPSSAPDWARNPDAAALAKSWEAVAVERGQWMAARSDEDFGAMISYRRLNGEPGSTRLDVLVRHVVNHSTYHRGQVMAFLRNLGKTPPSSDLVLWELLRTG
jgi:uncharacterized damage-inducible protein DinB